MEDSEIPSTPPNNTTPESPSNPLLRASNPLVTDLEQEVLDEYSRLLGNVNKVHSVPLLPCFIPCVQWKTQSNNTVRSYPINYQTSPAPHPP